MKVLGISFGRKNQRSDVLEKEALFAAKRRERMCSLLTRLH